MRSSYRSFVERRQPRFRILSATVGSNRDARPLASQSWSSCPRGYRVQPHAPALGQTAAGGPRPEQGAVSVGEVRVRAAYRRPSASRNRSSSNRGNGRRGARIVWRTFAVAPAERVRQFRRGVAGIGHGLEAARRPNADPGPEIELRRLVAAELQQNAERTGRPRRRSPTRRWGSPPIRPAQACISAGRTRPPGMPGRISDLRPAPVAAHQPWPGRAGSPAGRPAASRRERAPVPTPPSPAARPPAPGASRRRRGRRRRTAARRRRPACPAARPAPRGHRPNHWASSSSTASTSSRSSRSVGPAAARQPSSPRRPLRTGRPLVADGPHHQAVAQVRPAPGGSAASAGQGR